MIDIVALVAIEGLIYGIMALGVFMSFRLLNFPDLTIDGSFPLGAAVMAFCLINKIPIFASTIMVFASGFVAGVITATIHNTLKIPGLLAGILTMTILYSINLRIQNFSPNISFLKVETIFQTFSRITGNVLEPRYSVLLIMVILFFVIKLILDLFFHTDLGLTLGALGNNEQMIISQSINPKLLKIIALGFSNGLVAISGALAAQFQGQADVNLGRGIVIMGLASLMLGEFLIKSNKIVLLTLRVLLGSILFRGLMFWARSMTFLSLRPSDIHLIYGIFILVLLFFTNRKSLKEGNGG